MKKSILLLFVFIGLGATVFSQIPTNGLISWYPFNGNANDQSGGNNGIVHGAVLTADRFGNPNSAYYFDGINDFISAAATGLPLGNQPRTISAWIRNDSKPDPDGIGNDSHPIVCYGSPNTNSATELLFWLQGSQDMLRFAGFNNDLELPVSYDTLSWYHFVATFDGLTATIYFDNTFVGSGNFPGWNTLLDSLVIGTQTPRTRWHHGAIDDIRIYDRVLDTLEITSLFDESICTQTIYDTVHVTVYDTVAIAVTDTLIIDAELTGINPPNNINTIKIYPNPAATHVTIDNGDYTRMNGYTLRIDNSAGQTVFTSLINQQQFSVDLSTWTGNGTYFVYVIDQLSNTLDVRKIVIQ